MDILTKLQSTSLKTRKIILWFIVVSLALFLFARWVKNAKEKVSSFQKQEIIEEMKIPELKKEIEGLPKFEF